jgi:DNA-binding transcriptional LysR family regulator
MQLDHLNVLAAFLTIAEERSFTKAARRLGVSRSALSHAVRGLEERLGVRLLARTTRSVAATEAGEQLIARLRPALGEVESVLDAIVGSRDQPKGRVRLLVTPLSAAMVLAPKIAAFGRRFPDIVLEVTTTQEGRAELVATGFDAGIHLGESIQRDMVAVRVSHDQRLAIVGSPGYFASHPKPKTPHDLPRHRCINLRAGSSRPYRWEFEKDGETLAVDVTGPLIVDDADLMIRAASEGLGLTFSFEEYIAPQLASGVVVRVLEDWCPPFPGYFLYYPSRRQQPAALSALIDMLRLDDRPGVTSRPAGP